MARPDTLALEVELRQILRAAIRDSPFPIFNAEGRSLLLSFFSTLGRGLLSRRFITLALFTSCLLNDLRGLLRLRKLLILDFIFIDVLLFSFELKADDALHLTDMLLNHKELIHEPELEAIFFPRESV